MAAENRYIHGYSEEEQARLLDQNEVLAPYIYRGLGLPTIGHIVEVGCGVGAQMMTLLHRFPDVHVTGVELSPKQLRKAQVNLERFPSYQGRYQLIEADAFKWSPSLNASIDAVLMVWVLEHVPDPAGLLKQVRSWIPRDTSLWVTEVLHSTFHIWPENEHIMRYWEDISRCQRVLGGDPDVGARLSTLMRDAGFENVRTWPNVKFLDSTNPGERSRLLAYWLELMRSALHEALDAGETTLESWQKAEAGMRELMELPETTFFYSSIQAEASWASSE